MSTLGKTYCKSKSLITLSEDFATVYLKNEGAVIVDLDCVDIIQNYSWRKSDSGYACTARQHKLIWMHRLLMGIVEEDWTKIQVDHIDNDKLNNRMSNLRLCTIGQNLLNVSPRKDNLAQVSGVNLNKRDNLWVARIMINGKCVYLGSFKNKEDAIKLRLQKEIEIYGEFSKYYREVT